MPKPTRGNETYVLGLTVDHSLHPISFMYSVSIPSSSNVYLIHVSVVSWLRNTVAWDHEGHVSRDSFTINTGIGCRRPTWLGESFLGRTLTRFLSGQSPGQPGVLQ